MHVPHDKLPDRGPVIVIVAVLSLLLVLCVLVLLPNHIVPRYGMLARPSESHFVMGAYDRATGHVVSVAPGDTPRVYVESKEIPGGLQGFEECLRQWDCDTPSRVRVLLVVDAAVPAGVMQQLTDMVLSHGFSCGFSGIPNHE